MCLGHVSNVGFEIRVRDPTAKFFAFRLSYSLSALLTAIERVSDSD